MLSLPRSSCTARAPARYLTGIRHVTCRGTCSKPRFQKKDLESLGDSIKEQFSDGKDAARDALEDAKDGVQSASSDATDRVEEARDNASDKVSDAADNVSDKVSDLGDEASDAGDKASNQASNLGDKASNAVNSLSEKASSLTDNLSDKASNLTGGESASDAVDSAKAAAAGATDHIAELGKSTRAFKTLIGATMIGYAVLAAGIFFPSLFSSFGLSVEAAQIAQHNVWYNNLGSVFAAFAAVSAAALKNPLKFSPVFALQAVYKAIWLATTVAPAVLAGSLSAVNGIYAAITTVVLAADVLFVPWDYVLEEVRGVSKEAREKADEVRSKAEDAYA